MDGLERMRSTLAFERMRSGLSVEKVAETVGVEPEEVSAWELGSAEPLGSQIVALATVYGCSADYLVGIADERE